MRFRKKAKIESPDPASDLTAPPAAPPATPSSGDAEVKIELDATPPTTQLGRTDRVIDLTHRADPATGSAVKKLREGGHLNRASDDDAVYPAGAPDVVPASQTPLA
jgi:hypothetical protein